ncbi:ABC transporter permease subunit [Ruminococcaceae bacterium OttesenSCG-928-L11]|nr:ABC transporter permease subunit [Ruminococcaceae bacterium OttesenSCG-928-L11]
MNQKRTVSQTPVTPYTEIVPDGAAAIYGITRAGCPHTGGKRCSVKKVIQNIRRHPMVHIMVIPVVAYYLIFHYLPMYGVLIAFQNFVPSRSLWDNQWVGLMHFKDFFSDIYFTRLIKNTLSINIGLLLVGFPMPILFALMLNEVKSKRFKGFTQTVTYMPHFISSVVLCGIVVNFCKSTGLITYILTLFGFPKTNLLIVPSMFKPIFVGMNIWQNLGWDSIIYLAALSGIDPTLYEAADVDGAGRFSKMWNITLPGIAPTIVMLLILRIGRLMSLGWEQIILLYNPMIYETADVISTYVYRRGLIQFDYSFAAAVGLFNSVINLILLISANYISRRVNETSLW